MRFVVPLSALVALACGSRTGLDVPVANADDQVDASPVVESPDVATPSLLPPPAPTSTGACGPGSCAGCCDSTGTCQPGNAVSACGEQGRACATCNVHFELCSPDPANPDGQVCFSPCNLKSCNYHCCMPDGSCAPGDADDACGNTGAICDDCTTQGQVCAATNAVHACAAR